MIRLTVISQTEEEVVLKVEGWVLGGNVVLLEEEGTRLLGESERLVLDLEGVRSVDLEGIAVLQCWSGERLLLRGASGFVRRRLAKHGLV
jgi:hypothetical protein